MRKLFLSICVLMPALAWAAPLKVFVSVPPQRTFVEQVGGDYVQVRIMVKPEHNPATYDPTPQQITALATTDLYIRTGVPFEKAWMSRIRAANPHMRVVDARQGIDVRELDRHEHTKADPRAPVEGHGHADEPESERDPHVWTSPPLVKHMSLNIRDALAELDPSNGPHYAHNQKTFAAELDALDRDIRKLLKDIPTRRFMVFHPAWGYFADTYGLTQIPIEKAGREPGGRTLAALIEQTRGENVRVIFVQPQFNTRPAERVAHAIGGRVVAIDPLSPNYADNLRRVARVIAEAARQ